MDCPELISGFLEAQKNVKEKPAPVKRKASTDEPETEAKKKDVVSSLIPLSPWTKKVQQHLAFVFSGKVQFGIDSWVK